MKRITITIIAIVAVGLTVAVSRTIMVDEDDSVKFTYNTEVLQTGDLVFVRGTSWQSQIVLLTDLSNQFSHLGLIWVHNDTISVIHATPNTYSASDVEGVVIEPLQIFLSPKLITKAAAFRYKDMTNKLASEIVTYAKQYASKQIAFDYRFNFSSDTKLYCTEFIWRIYHKAGVNLFKRNEIKGILMPSQISSSNRLFKLIGFNFKSSKN